MMKTLLILSLFSALLCVALAEKIPNTPGFSIDEALGYTEYATSGDSAMYTVQLSNSTSYQYPIYFVNLVGSRYDMGYDYGVMAASLVVEAYNTFFQGLLGESTPEFIVSLVQDIFADLCRWQWDQWLSLQVPEQYISELQGVSDGGASVGVNDLESIMVQILVLANVPSDISDLRYVIHNELELHQSGYNNDLKTSLTTAIRSWLNRDYRSAPQGAQCSMFGVWGSRTENGDLYSARNLDWAANLGLDQFKSIIVWQPNDGSHSHLAVGYVCVWGALTGMSSQGISVAEANLEVDQETFLGFPWLLRLRYIMEKASNLGEAWALWEYTNNTVGFNHMVASANDAAKGLHAALALETMAGYTGFFLDNDPREKYAKYIDPNTNETVLIGYPMDDALWRTNHGYDPTIRTHYMWRQMNAGTWSLERYMFAYEAFTYYEMNDISISYIEAINVTSILGDKGNTAYQCQDSNVGDNIISATYKPGDKLVWASWENGSGSNWRPAACNTYVLFDMNEWF